jgi:hypothetical protein
MMQREFHKRFGIYPPFMCNIYGWYKQLEVDGCVFKKEIDRRPHVSEDNSYRIRQAYQRSPQKSTYQGSHELELPQATIGL